MFHLDASRTRVRCGWRKFNDNEVAYCTCVRSAMVYGSETWPVIKEDLGKLERAEHTMIRRCGVTLRDRVPSKELYSRLGIDSISSVVTWSRLL